MKRLVEKYRGTRTTDTDYTQLLIDTNVFGAGKDLVFDEASYRWLANRMSEAEARLDLAAANDAIATGASVDASSMKTTSNLEDFAFFSRFVPDDGPCRVLYVGGGAYPTIALYALGRYPGLTIDSIDIVPHCTVLCEQLAAALGLADRLLAYTENVFDWRGELAGYDGIFVSSAVRPKADILTHILTHKRPGAPVYCREDEAHPLFYEPVTVVHPDLTGARAARAAWAAAHGSPFPLPRGCETDE